MENDKLQAPHYGCTCQLCMPHLWAAGIKGSGQRNPASEPERVSDDLLNEIADGHSSLGTTVEAAGNMADELRTLRAQLAEKDAAIEKARRDALEEAEACIPTNWLDPLLSGSGKVVAKSPCNEIEALLSAVTKRIRALAAQKKEG